MAYEIEKGIPMPESKSSGDSFEAIALMKRLEITDSFQYADNDKSRAVTERFRAAARKAGIKITTRKLADGRYRLWRIE